MKVTTVAMNFQQLRCFHAVAIYGSFTEAAKALFVGQPSITTHIKTLEKRFGIELFYRYGHTVKLTRTGQDLLKVTSEIFSLENTCQELLKAAGGLLEGDIRISAFDPIQVIKVASKFNYQHPDIKIKVSFGNAENLIESLVSLQADVSILPELGDKRLHTEPYKRVNIAVLVNSDDPWSDRAEVHIDELEGRKMIVREQGSMQQRIVNEILDEHGVQVTPVLEIDSQDAVREAIFAGMGIGIALDVSKYYDPRLKLITLSAFKGEPLMLNLDLACLLERKESPVIKAFFGTFKK